MIKLLALAVLAAITGTAKLPAQSFVQISSVRARPEVLTCAGPGATTIVRLQIYLAAIPEAAKGSNATVELAISSAHPSGNSVDIREGSKAFSLAQSPALVDFEVNCNGETVPGDIALSAVISQAPEGIPVKEPGTDPTVHLKIVRLK